MRSGCKFARVGAALSRDSLFARVGAALSRDRGQGPLLQQGLASLERIRVQIVAREQLVEVRAIAFCQASRLTHIAHRDLQNL